MKKYIIIQADTNDGDYVQSKNLITNEQLELIKPVIEAIKNFKPYESMTKGRGEPQPWTHNSNYPWGECIREDLGQLSAEEYYVGIEGITSEQFEVFDNFVPYNEYGIHTIEKVEILEVTNEERLL